MPRRGEAAAVFVREPFTQEARIVGALRIAEALHIAEVLRTVAALRIAGVITAAASAPQPLELLPSARQ
jgi:hypothetical protein